MRRKQIIRKCLKKADLKQKTIHQVSWVSKSQKTMGLILDHPEYIRQRISQGERLSVLTQDARSLKAAKKMATRCLRTRRSYVSQHCRDCNLIRQSLEGPHFFCRGCTKALSQSMSRAKLLTNSLITELRRADNISVKHAAGEVARLEMVKGQGQRLLLGHLSRFFEGAEQILEATYQLQKDLAIMFNNFSSVRFEVKAELQDWDKVAKFYLLISGTIRFKLMFGLDNCEAEWLTGRMKELTQQIMLFVVQPLRTRWNQLCATL